LRKPRRGRKNRDKYFCQNCIDRNYLIECECGCNKLLFRYSESGQLRRFINGHNCRSLEHHFYKNGRFKMGNNYYMIRIPGYFSNDKYGRVYEHVYFYQEYYQCCLLHWGEVHHIIPVTEDYCNNMPWNLIGMMKSEHRKLSNKFKIYNKKDRSNTSCSICDSTTTYIDKKGYEHWYEGPVCKKCWSEKYRKIKTVLKGLSVPTHSLN
jgi:hypothetical protein